MVVMPSLEDFVGASVVVTERVLLRADFVATIGANILIGLFFDFAPLGRRQLYRDWHFRQ